MLHHEYEVPEMPKKLGVAGTLLSYMLCNITITGVMGLFFLVYIAISVVVGGITPGIPGLLFIALLIGLLFSYRRILMCLQNMLQRWSKAQETKRKERQEAAKSCVEKEALARSLSAEQIEHISQAIRIQLYSLHGLGTKWGWAVHPHNTVVDSGESVDEEKWATAINGKILVVDLLNTRCYMDVVVDEHGVVHLDEILAETTAESAYPLIPTPTSKASDCDTWHNEQAEPTEEGADKATVTTALSEDDKIRSWYRIVVSSELESAITRLSGEGYGFLVIDRNGKVYSGGEVYSAEHIHEFADMPNEEQWHVVAEMIGDDGLFAEVRDEKIFVSWPL